MELRPSHSHLQNRILLSLRQRPVENLAALARDLEAKRSSVSRAMHALQAEGLVTRDNDVWLLTPAGETETLNIRKKLPDQVQKAGISVRRLVEQSQLAGTTEPLFQEILAPFREVAANSLESTDTVMAQIAALPTSSTALLTDIEKLTALSDAVAAQTAQIPEIALAAQTFTSIQDSLQSYFTEQDRRFAEITQSFWSGVDEKKQLISAYETFLGESTALMGLTSAHDSIVAQVAGSAHLYESAMATILQDVEAPSASIFAALRLSKVGSLTKLLDITFPSPTTLDAIKYLACLPSPAELAASQFFQAQDTPITSFIDIGSRLVQESVTSFAESQRLNLALIQQATDWEPASAAITRVLDTNNQRLSHILSDLSAVRVQAFAEPTLAMAAATLMPDVAAVARSYRGYLAEVAADFTRSEWDVGTMSIALPTQTTASLVSTVRAIVVLEQDDTEDVELRSASPPSPWERRAGLVDHVIAQQGPQFIRLWHGSWAVLESDSPDRVRQAAHSGRELLMQVLATLAPDSMFTLDELKQQRVDKPTRKMRVRRILAGRSSATVNLVETIAKSLDELYDRLAGISHDRSAVLLTTEYAISGWLTTLGGLLVILLDKDRHLE